MSSPCCHFLSHLPSPIVLSTSKIRVLKLARTSVQFNRTPRIVNSCSRSSKTKWRFSCFRNGESTSESFEPEYVEEKIAEGLVSPEFDQSHTVKDNCLTNLRKATDAVFSAEPWAVPWTAKTILQMFGWTDRMEGKERRDCAGCCNCCSWCNGSSFCE